MSTEKKTILFVDDEPNILAGLKRMLRSLRKEMHFEFAENGPAALDLMRERKVDVVVSDMRMPGMDGATLLTTIKERYPEVIRIMLTGQADDESIMKTVGVVHQFLAKPADPDFLKQVITRASALQDLMKDEGLKRLISGVGVLPTLPETYARLQQTIKDPEAGLGDVAAVIEQDLAMSAKVLQLVNSAFFGLYKQIENPVRAVNLLGLDTIKALVLGVGIFNELAPAGKGRFNVSGLFDHSFAVAAFAKRIALACDLDQENVDHCFTGGLLHDVGKLLLYSRRPEEYEQAIELAEAKAMRLDQAEHQVFGAGHDDVGGYLIGLWGLPGAIVEGITFHHRLADYPDPDLCPVLVIHVADWIHHQLHPEICHGAPPELAEPVLTRIGVMDRVKDWERECRSLSEEDNDE